MVKNTSYHHALPFYISKRFFWLFQAHIIHHMAVFRLFVLFSLHKFDINYNLYTCSKKRGWCKTLPIIMLYYALYFKIICRFQAQVIYHMAVFAYFAVFWHKLDINYDIYACSKIKEWCKILPKA